MPCKGVSRVYGVSQSAIRLGNFLPGSRETLIALFKFFFSYAAFSAKKHMESIDYQKKKKKKHKESTKKKLQGYFNFVFSVSFPYQLRETEIHFVYSVGFPYEGKETERKLKGFV